MNADMSYCYVLEASPYKKLLNIKFGSSDFHSSKVLSRIHALGHDGKKMSDGKFKVNMLFKHLIFLKMLNKLISYDISK